MSFRLPEKGGNAYQIRKVGVTVDFHWIRIRSRADRLEEDSFRLFECGASGVVEEEIPSEAKGSPEELFLRGYYTDSVRWAEAQSEFSGRIGFESGSEANRDWLEDWHSEQKPIEVTPGLRVDPPWWATPYPEGHILKLEPKMAFGMGSHESTRLAAFLLESLELRGKSALDIGAGTGILGLYAAVLGASWVVAHDNDPVTGPCLRENANLNLDRGKVAFSALVATTDALKPTARFDVIICNMLRTELWSFRSELVSRLKPKGVFVVSGQLLRDKEYFTADAQTTGYRIVREQTMDPWWAFIGEKA